MGVSMKAIRSGFWILAGCGILLSAVARGTPRNDFEQRLLEHFLVSDHSEDGFADVVADREGRATTVIGRFDVGLDADSSWDEAEVADATARFLIIHGEAFGLRPGETVALKVVRIDALDDSTHVASVQQVHGDRRVPVVDREMSAVFWADGSLHSVNGSVLPNTPLPEPDLQPADAVASARPTGEAEPAELVPEVVDGTTIYTAPGVAVELMTDGFGALVWRVRDKHWVTIVDDATGAISHAHDTRRFVNGSCNVRYRDFEKNANGFTTMLIADPDYVSPGTTGTRTEQLTCQADDWFGTCYWKLRYEGVTHSINRVEDESGAEVEVAQSCSSSAVPQLTSAGGNSLREQTAFWAANHMRTFTLQNVWNQVAPNRTESVDYHIDGDYYTCGHFNPTTTSIHLEPACGLTDIFLHEYGHYVSWSYNGLSSACSDGTNEGDPLEETVANLFAMITVADDPDTKPLYGSLGEGGSLPRDGLGGGQGPAPHITGAGLQLPTVDCTVVDKHLIGNAFEQAVWELLFDHDCTAAGSACASADTLDDGAEIWDLGDEAVITRVGASLAFAHKALGTDVTFAQFRAQMIAKIQVDSGATIANRASAVFSHHGI